MHAQTKQNFIPIVSQTQNTFYLLHFDILVAKNLQTGTSALNSCRWRYEHCN